MLNKLFLAELLQMNAQINNREKCKKELIGNR